MAVHFESLLVGREYDRPYLSNYWEYGSHHAISRGVITPTGQNIIILFVTKEKQEAFTQYNDYIDECWLYWEGESKHGSDDRIINAQAQGDEIHLFYRNRHHSPFVYHGPIVLEDCQRNTEQPSEFIFSISRLSKETDPFEDVAEHGGEFSNLTKTERNAIVKSRIGQGRFRQGLISMWGGCSVTGLQNLRLLNASHAKPWRDCSNEERLTPYNGLLLNPSLDVLFDAGFIGFNEEGQIQLSSHMALDEYQLLGVHNSMQLRKNYSGAHGYLKYHIEHIFKYST